MALTDIKVRRAARAPDKEKRKQSRLSTKAVENAKPREKIYKLFDGNGLHLVVTPNGSRFWRLKYYFSKKERMLALGVFPDVSLAAAHELRDKYREQIADGIDPASERAAAKKAKSATAGDSFEAIARQWLALRAPHWKPSHYTNVESRLERLILPKLGDLPIDTIDADKILEVVNAIDDRFETARRVCQIIGAVIRYACWKRKAKSDPTVGLREGFTHEAGNRKVRHHPAVLDPVSVGGLMRSIEGYSGSMVVRSALRLHALTALRSGELRNATWAEIDFETATWRVPAERMKVSEAGDHIVPLSRQAVEVLEGLHRVTGDGRYIFPSGRGQARPLSENGVTAALRALGYTKLVEVKDKNGKVRNKPVSTQSAHGFRSIFSTLLHELGERSDLIEKQLAHADSNSIRATYNHAQYLTDRRALMQRWADYLDQLTAGNPKKDTPRKVSGLTIVSKTVPRKSPVSTPTRRRFAGSV
jgi:integrase